jgi:exodeoxyribonuclease VII large subunit
MQKVDALARRLVHPAERLRNARRDLSHLALRLAAAMKHRFVELRAQLQRGEAVLAGLDQMKVLARGYSLTLNAGGEIVRSPAAVAVGERIVTRLAKGEIESEVRKKSA